MTAADVTTLACTQLTIRVPGRTLVAGLDLELRAGSLLAVLGQNGAGKSLTLHTLAGLRSPDGGSVSLGGHDMNLLRRRDIATRLALLPQYGDDVFPTTVMDTVMSGRHPHVPPLQWETARDHDIARHSLRLMGLQTLAHRDVATLSGGERRRLDIAQILAQAPATYLLDEPTNHLDPQHQLDVLNVFADAVQQGAAVAASLHDVNLAARYADRCLLLFGDGRWHCGPTDDVLGTGRLSELYGTTMESVAWRDRQLFIAAGAPAPGVQSH